MQHKLGASTNSSLNKFSSSVGKPASMQRIHPEPETMREMTQEAYQGRKNEGACIEFEETVSKEPLLF